MEKESKILIGAIFSVLLLVALGISFAYFLAGNSTSGNAQGSTDVQTLSIEKGGNLKIEGALEFNDLDILPGHKNVSKIKVTATGNGPVYYNLIWNGTNSLNTPLNYTVYQTTTDEAPAITCNKVVRGQKYYEECINTNFQNLGTSISTGTISTSNIETKHIISQNNEMLATKDGEILYYYVVLEYPNLNESQNIDMEGKFEGIATAEFIKKNDTP